jgi:hypothetical protein
MHIHKIESDVPYSRRMTVGETKIAGMKTNSMLSNGMPQQDLLVPVDKKKRRKPLLRKSNTDVLGTQEEEKDACNTSQRSSKSQISALRSQYTISTHSCISTKTGGKKQINQYVTVDQIGRGAFAKVKKIIDTESRELYAMKVINKDRLCRDSIFLSRES